jgi:hypothetical protein
MIDITRTMRQKIRPMPVFLGGLGGGAVTGKPAIGG